MDSNNIETIFSKLFTYKKLVNSFTEPSNIIHTQKEISLESVPNIEKKGSSESSNEEFKEITLFIY